MPVAALVCSLFLQGAPTEEAQPEPTPVTLAGEYFEVTAYGLPDGAVEVALAEAEAARAAVLEALGPQAVAIEEKLRVRIWAEREGFDVMVSRLQDENGPSHYSEVASGQAYVSVDPVLSSAALELYGLPWNTRRWIAIESARLALHAHCAQASRLPAWVADGLPLWAGESAAARMDPDYRIEDDPFYQSSRSWIRRLVEEKDLRRLQDILLGKVNDEWLMRWSDGLYHHAFRFLMQEQAEDARLLVDAATAPAGRGTSSNPEKRVEKLLRGRRGKQLDKGFDAYALALESKWRSTLRWRSRTNWRGLSGMLDTRGTRWVHVASPDDAEYTYCNVPPGKNGYVLRGRLELGPEEEGELGLIVMSTDLAGFFVGFATGPGTVDVQEYDQVREEWVPHLEVEHEAVRASGAFEFEVRVERRKLIVLIDGKQVIELVHGRRKLVGEWGLYAAEGSTGVWEGLTLEDPAR